MTAFFVKTEQSSAGPFTGVELREAALAGIVGPQCQIGGGPNGPWVKAEDAGLFSEKKLPLPHPPGTTVPQYQVRGMQGGLTGPFKLRELIGFAARGMLPTDAMLKSDSSHEWISLDRIPVLVACLCGQLVVLGESGKVHLRTRSASTGQATTSSQAVEATLAPVQATKSIDITTSSAHVRRDTAAPEPQLVIVGDEGLVIEEDEVDTVTETELDESDKSAESGESGASKRRRLRLPEFRFDLPASLRPRLIVNVLCLLIAFVGIGGAYSYWRHIAMSSHEILGDWIGGGKAGIPVFGLSFREDGSCVIFNTQGECWSGDYAWATRSDDSAGFQDIDPFSAEVDKIDPADEIGPVQPTDGYIRLRGFVEDPPMIGRHRVGDCFLRRENETLRIGYLANVTWTQTAKTLDAGWIAVRPLQVNKGVDVMTDLESMEFEQPPVRGYSVEKSAHISAAITALKNSQETDALDGDVDNGSTCYSIAVDAEYLLRTYGIPDEARPLYPFEIPQLSLGQSFEGSQIVRYGKLKLFVRSDGTLQYVSIML